MASAKEFSNEVTPAWCPGCGNFAMWNAIKRAIPQAGLAPHEVMMVSGIGQSSKMPDYVNANGITTLHGRPLPVAQGIHLANHKLKVIVHSGDGDAYGIGGNHFVHFMRRNANITLIAHDNLVYGLTKGQYSPTSRKGFTSSTSPPPTGAIEEPVNPIAMALAASATFIARAFAGDFTHMVEMMVLAIQHRGAALLDVFQPCVVFNPRYSFDFYRPRVYKLQEEDGYDPSDRDAAWAKAHEWGDRIPIGLFYQQEGVPTYVDQVPSLADGTLVSRGMPTWTEENYRNLEAEYL